MSYRVLENIVHEHMGFVTEADVPVLLSFAPDLKVLVRTGMNRYTCRLDQLQQVFDKVEAADDYVRDVSIPVDGYDAIKAGASYIKGSEKIMAKH